MSKFNAATTLSPQAPAKPGGVARALLRLMTRPARVAAVEALSPRFRLIDLEGDGLKGVAWSPGQKVQVVIGSGLSTRTYTPLSWDAESGRTRVLVFLHGEGPGSLWADGLLAGQDCQVLGPRRSLDLEDNHAPVVLFGDETSFGLAAALQGGSADAELTFEVSDADESRSVLTALGLGRATVTERRDGDAHLPAIGANLSLHLARGALFVLTGKAQSIQNVSQVLRKSGMASSGVRSKAYWSPGKTGLD